jgi:hypothetical protein
MMDPDHPDVTRSLREASLRVEAFRGELLAAYPALRGSLAIPGMLIGTGLGSFVANDMTDDQIVEYVGACIAQIRDELRKVKPSA